MDKTNKKLNGEPLRLNSKRAVQPIRLTPCSICQNKRTIQPIRPTPCSSCQNKKSFPSILHIQTSQAAFRAGYKFIHISNSGRINNCMYISSTAFMCSPGKKRSTQVINTNKNTSILNKAQQLTVSNLVFYAQSTSTVISGRKEPTGKEQVVAYYVPSQCMLHLFRQKKDQQWILMAFMFVCCCCLFPCCYCCLAGGKRRGCTTTVIRGWCCLPVSI